MKSSNTNVLLRVLDLCIPPGFLELDIYDIILRSRITAGFLLISALATYLVPGILVTFAGFSLASQASMLMLGTLYLGLVMLFRFTGSFFAVGNLYAVFSYAALYMSVDTFGTGTHNPLLPFLLAIPLITFIIANKYTGLFWTIINIVIFVLHDMQQQLPASSMLDSNLLHILHIAVWSILAITFFIILFTYDMLNAKLRYVISEERNHFEYEAGHDKLTGLLNRASFQQRLALNVERARLNKTTAIIGLIDLDGFKPVNDQIGHHAGDVVLKEVSARLQKAMRTTDTLARLGGDEFAFVLNEVADRPDVNAKVQAMLDAIAMPIDIDGQMVQISGSIGLARCPEDRAQPYDVLKAADMAMYEAKNSKGRYVHYADMLIAEGQTP